MPVHHTRGGILRAFPSQSISASGGAREVHVPSRPRPRRGRPPGSARFRVRPDLALPPRRALPGSRQRDLGRPRLRERALAAPTTTARGRRRLLPRHGMDSQGGAGGGPRGREAHPPDLPREVVVSARRPRRWLVRPGRARSSPTTARSPCPSPTGAAAPPWRRSSSMSARRRCGRLPGPGGEGPDRPRLGRRGRLAPSRRS